MAKAKKPKKPRAVRKVRKIRKLRRKRVVTKADVTTSKVEQVFKKWLQETLKLSIEDQFRIAFKWFDFRVLGTNILIELDGDYWHCNPNIYTEGAVNSMQRRNILNDKRKNALAASNGYQLIRVWEDDFKKKKTEVKKRILDAVKDYKTKEKPDAAKS